MVRIVQTALRTTIELEPGLLAIVSDSSGCGDLTIVRSCLKEYFKQITDAYAACSCCNVLKPTKVRMPDRSWWTHPSSVSDHTYDLMFEDNSSDSDNDGEVQTVAFFRDCHESLNCVCQEAVPVATGADGFDREVDGLLPATDLTPVTGYLRLADDALADTRPDSPDQSSYDYGNINTAFS
jgi:hypothetical protein